MPFSKLQYFFLRDRGLAEEGERKKTVFAFLLCLKAMYFMSSATFLRTILGQVSHLPFERKLESRHLFDAKAHLSYYPSMSLWDASLKNLMEKGE